MSGIQSLESFPNAVVEFVLQLPRGLWSAVVHPVPKLMSPEVKSTDLLTPLAYFGLLMTVSMLLNQLWLFTFSAFCIVWVETQMAWKAQEVGKARADAHRAESIASAQSITQSEAQSKDIKEEPMLPEFLQQTKEDLMNHFASNITSATVCVFPTQVMTTQFSAEEQARIESDIERSLEIQLEQQRQHPPSYHAPPPRLEGLQTVFEEDEPSADRNFTLMSDMAVVQRELAQVLGLCQRHSPSSSSSSKAGELASVDYPIRPHGPQPSIVVEDLLDDNVSNIFSMEELDDHPSTATSSIRDDSHSARSLTFPRSPVAFPMIDDVLSEYEASFHAIEPLSQSTMNDEIDEALTSGDESQHNAIFSDDDEDYDGIRSASPAATSVDGADDVEGKLPKSVVVTVRKPGRRRSSTKKSPPKKNNGWKTIPKKNRLNPRQKKRFVSRAFW